MSWMLLAVVLVPAVSALISGALGADRSERVRPLAVWASGATLAAGVVLLFGVAVDGRVDLVTESSDGRAILGLTAGRVEAALVVLTSFVGLIVQSFASRSLVGDGRAARFHALALAIVAATNLVAVAASGSTFVLGWVATSMAVASVVAHRRGWHAADGARRSVQRLLGLGDLSLLVGVVVITTSTGHLDLRSLGDVVVEMDSDGAVTLAALLLVTAGLVRSAILPFGAWLPATLAAPTPVSALLHAGVVNGAGVLLIRFHPLVVESTAALVVAYVAGVTTAVVATAVMIVRTDVKGALVWSTAGQMGFMVAQIGAGAFAAALFHIIGHAMYKAAAFLGAGEAVAARNRRTFQPHAAGGASLVTVSLSLGIAAASVAGALLVLDPHLADSGLVLVAVFATLTLARAVHGWVVSTALAAGVVVPAAVAGSVAAAFAYVGGLKLVEGFVVDELPFEVPGAVGAPWVVLTVVAVAAVALITSRLPGATGDAWRAAVWARLVAFGASAAPSAPSGTAGPAGPLRAASPAPATDPAPERIDA